MKTLKDLKWYEFFYHWIKGDLEDFEEDPQPTHNYTNDYFGN